MAVPAGFKKQSYGIARSKASHGLHRETSRMCSRHVPPKHWAGMQPHVHVRSQHVVQVYLHLWLKAIRMPEHVLIRGFCVDEDLQHFQEGYGGLIRAGFNRDDMKLRLRYEHVSISLLSQGYAGLSIDIQCIAYECCF